MLAFVAYNTIDAQTRALTVRMQRLITVEFLIDVFDRIDLSDLGLGTTSKAISDRVTAERL